MNPMQELKIEKITLNIGAGKDQNLLKKGEKLIQNITGIKPVVTKTNKRIPTWSLRPGLPIGVKLTLRKEQAIKLLPRLLSSKSNTLKESNFDDAGNVSFGIPEYVDIDGVKYDPEIGIMGLQVCVTIEKPGYRTKKRRLFTSKVGKTQRVTKQESIEFMKKNFKVELSQDNEDE